MTAGNSQILDAFEQKYRQHRLRRFGRGALAVAIIAVLTLWSADVSQLTFARLWDALPRMGDYIVRTLPEISLSDLFGDLAYWFYDFPRWLRLLLDTLLIAALATFFGAILGGLLCFPASRNLMPIAWLCFACRRFAEVTRTIPEVVYALIFVVAFGVGPMAGLLALTLHSMGALAKLYSEVNENIDRKPLDGLRAAGASWTQIMGFGVLPQVLPDYVTYTLWRLELNVRAAAIIGFVGAGGIGQELYKAISLSYYEDISAIVLMVIATVMLIDMVCERIRHHLIGQESFR